MLGDRAIGSIGAAIDSVGGTLFDVGQFVARVIRDRTRFQMIDRTGKPFTPYNEKYARSKRRSRTAVNMTADGEMLNSITTVDSNGVRLDSRPQVQRLRGQPGNRGQFVAAGDIEVGVGPTGTRNVRLMEIHERGLGRMPAGGRARQMMGLTPQEIDEATQLFRNRLQPAEPTTEEREIRVTLGG